MSVGSRLVGVLGVLTAIIAVSVATCESRWDGTAQSGLLDMHTPDKLIRQTGSSFRIYPKYVDTGRVFEEEYLEVNIMDLVEVMDDSFSPFTNITAFFDQSTAHSCFGWHETQDIIDADGKPIRIESVNWNFYWTNGLNITTQIQIYNDTARLVFPGDLSVIVLGGDLKFNLEMHDFPFTVGQYALTRLRFALYTPNFGFSYGGLPVTVISSWVGNYTVWNGFFASQVLNVTYSLQQWVTINGTTPQRLYVEAPETTGLWFINAEPPTHIGGISLVYWNRASDISWDPSFSLLFTATDPAIPTAPEEPQPINSVAIGVSIGVVAVAAIGVVAFFGIRAQNRRKSDHARIAALRSSAVEDNSHSSVSSTPVSSPQTTTWKSSSAADARKADLRNTHTH